ncbi:MAG: carbonic anhydrase family protein [Magnetococcales bacterium]|nr:carbonic anhydrase family protein [Magnetococcales bacterium]
MKSRYIFLAILVFFLIFVRIGPDKQPLSQWIKSTSSHHQQQNGHAADDSHAVAHWSYDGEGGPAHWGSLSEGNTLCDAGKKQSPVDLPVTEGACLLPALILPEAPMVLARHYGSVPVNIINNGHTIQLDGNQGGYITLDGLRYDLLQIHFHSPSEHTVGGKSYPLEAHMVHKSAEGGLAVVGVLMEEGAENAFLKPMWQGLPAKADQHFIQKDATLDINALLPGDETFLTLSGSLTTPPCSEDVRWLVMNTPVTLSAQQVKQFATLHPGSNRPVQPLNGRAVFVNQAGTLWMVK